MGDIRAGGTSYFLSLAQAVSGEDDPGLLNPAAPTLIEQTPAVAVC